VRGHRAATFMLEVSNREAEPVAFTLDGEATDVRVRFDNSTFQLRSGELARTKARLNPDSAVDGLLWVCLGLNMLVGGLWVVSGLRFV
jgi:hypothetical protein